MKTGIEKPNAVYVNIQDRKNGRCRSLTVYGASHSKVVARIRQAFGPHKKKSRQRQ